MYLTPTENHWAIDIEGDWIPSTKIFCACVIHVLSGKEYEFTDREQFLRFYQEKHNNGAIWVAHNGIKYDVPTLNRLWGTRISVSRIVDTLVLSMVYSPNLAGGHSLEAWGERVKVPKWNFTDFSQYTPEMLKYCMQDVRVLRKLYLKLSARMRSLDFSERGCEIEHKAWHIIRKQQVNGFAFDKENASVLFANLRSREAELRDEVYKQFPPVLTEVGHYKKHSKKNGERTALFEGHARQFPKIEMLGDGSYKVFDYVEFNLGSPIQRIEKLLEVGWTPTRRTKKGNPKVDEESLMAFAKESGMEAAQALAKWVVINSRANMVGTWLDAYNEETGCIHGDLWLAGTLRYKHSKPNSANVPAVRLDGDDHPIFGEQGFYTYESRDLWTTRDRERRDLVGVDAKGIQLRILANYINFPPFTENILSKDPHTANQKLMGLETRALTKTITYATLMGAGDARVAAEAKVSLNEAKLAKASFFEQVPGLEHLIAKLKGQVKRTGRISLCDGTPIIVPSDHMVIPYLLQGDESRIMKQAAIFLDEQVRRTGIDALKVGDIHDEWQTDVAKKDTEEFRRLATEAIAASGRSFSYHLPTDGDSKVGKTWAETH